MPPASNAGVARRRAILDAALTSFLKSGVAGATVEALHRESGASVGSIYHFFGSKEGVAAELYLKRFATTTTRILRYCRQVQARTMGWWVR